MPGAVRIGNEVYVGGKLFGVWERGSWNRYEGCGPGDRTLTPIEPGIGPLDERDRATCAAAKPPPPRPRAVAESERAMERIDAMFPKLHLHRPTSR